MASKPDQSSEHLDLLKALATLLREEDLTEVEYAYGDLEIRLAKSSPMIMAGAPAVAPAAAASAAVSATPVEASKADHPGAVTSPTVGTVYLSPSPGAPPFIRVGDTVTKGQTILIVEAMKVMNHIPAPRDGKVTEIVVSDRQPVEFGEALVIIE